MAVRDYSGFQAIVTSVEKLRETVTIEADKQLYVFRTIRDIQTFQLRGLERMVEGLRTRSQTRNNFGFDRLELKNVRLQAGAVTLTARSVIVETKGALNKEKKDKAESEQLAKVLGTEIKKIKVGGGLGNPLQILGAGILFQFGAQFAKGFEQSFGKKTGFTFQGTGQAAGDVTANSLKTVQSLLNDLVDNLEARINQITGRNKPIGERILTSSETLQKIQSKLGVSNNNPYAQKAVNNSITSFQNMLNVFKSGEYSMFFEASQKAVNSLTELLELISSENDLGEFAQDLGELLKIAIAFSGDEFSQIIKQSHSLLTTQKTLEGSSAELIGSLKQALSEQKIIEQGFRLVAREKHKSFFVNDQGKYIGTSNVGGRVLGFTATPQQSMAGVEQPVYEVAFSLDSQFSSLGQAAELTKKELIDLKNSVAEFFNKFVKSVDDAVLTATPENADQKGGRRASIYKRFGFVSEGEGNRLVAQVASGNVVNPDLQFNLKENEQVVKISEKIEKRLTATLKTFDDLFQENIKQAIEYAKSIIVGSELIQQDLEELEKEAKNVGYDQSPAIQAQNRIKQNLKNLQARINQSKRLQSDLTLQNFSKVDLTKRNDPSSKEKLAQIALEIVKVTKDAPTEISDKLLERVLQFQKQETKPNEPNQVSTKQDIVKTPNKVTLVDQYVVYLNKLIQDAQKQAEETVKGIIPDYKNLTILKRKETIGSYKADVVKEIKEFRKAIKEGNNQLALEIGENVLALVESTRKVYKDLLEAVPSDLSGTKSIEANQKYLTSIQNEVLKGQPNKAGSAKTSLMQLIGTETSEGFIKGIEDKLNQVRNSGEELAESAIEGAKKRLGIASPSKEFEKLGESSGEGFQIGIEKSLQDARSAIAQKIEKILNTDFYHGTSKAAAKSIRQQGIDVDRVQDATYGKGFYLTDKLGEAESYANEHRRPAVLKARLNVKNPFIVTEKGYQNFIKHAQKRGELPDPFAEPDPTGEKYEQYHRDKTKLLQKKGYDSVFVRDKGFAVAFEAEQVKLEESGKNAIESMIASIKKLFGKLFGLGEKSGQATTEGFVQGMQGDQSEAINAIGDLVDSVIEKAKDDLEIQSPSRKFRKMGQQSSAGFAEGLEDGKEDVKESVGSFWNTLENVPILGWFIKFGKLFAKLVADLFNSKSQPKKSPKKQDKVKVDQEAVQEILNMDFYHGTSKAGEKSILEKGVDVNRVQDAVYGKGFYLANKREEAESYSNDHKNPAVLKAKIKVKNPFIVTEEEYQEFIKNAQKKGELIDPFAEPDPTGEKYEQYHKDKTKLLQKKGYDSIFIKDKGFAVIFQAQQVEFEKATKKASKEITNNFYTRYIAYLDNLKAASKKHAMQKIASDDYRALSQQDKLKVGKQSFTEIKEQFKEFKEAVTVGNKELAAEVGEQLVIASETLKTIYDDLLQDLNSDDKLFKEIEKQKTALERLERTTIGGKANQKGLANIALETNRSLEIGESVGDGFVQGIESKIEEAGIVAETLSEQVIKEAEKRLGIQSPSRVFEEIGQRVVEGFNLGVQAIQSAIHTPIDQALTAVDNRFSVFIGNAQQGFNNFIQKLEQDFPIFAELKDVVLGLAAAFALNNVLEFLAGQIVALGDASFGAVLELESMRLAFTSVTGSAEAGAKGLAFVRKEAQRLGVELKTAEEAYAGFLAVTRYTALQGNQADRIFSVFQETAARRGLSNEEQGRMFAAINQAISKRKLSAEEVRGQLGEIPGLAFESTVARSMGVNPAQLSEMMGDGLLMAEDVFPRVAALYEAENAKIAESSETTSQALTRFQNAIVNLQRSFEGWIAPAKTFFNFFAAAIEKISEIIPIVVRYLGIFSAALLIDFATISIELGKFLGSLKSVQAVLSVLARIAVASFKLIYKELLIFLKQFALMTLAFDAVGAAIYVLSNNAFPELKKGIEEATTRANQLEQALQNVGKATQAIPTKLPKTEEEIVTNRTWNILGWDTGFNLEGTRQFLNNVDKAFGFKPTLTTLGQQELANFQENVGGVLSQVDRNLSKEFDVEKTIKEIRELDKELTKARSRQFNIPAGDKKRYEAAIKEQQKLLEERDKKLDVTANFEKALQGDKAEIEKYLKTLNELVAKKGITSEAEKAIRAQLEQRLKDIDKTSTAFDGLMSNLQRSVNALTSALRNLNEQAAYFNETLERNATNARVQFIRRAQASGVGSQITDLGLEQIDRNTLKSRVAFLRDQLSAVNNELSRPDFAALLTELRQQAEDAGINLENTATIDRLINENRSQQETAVLNALKEQLRLKDELGQTEENLERSIGSARSAIRDMNQSVEDFFFNLTQQIEEALVETQRILNKLKYTDIRNKLQRALVPGSDTFVNGLIGQIQGIFDQASGILEQVLGQRSAQINFAGERRGLQYELENFTRNLGGATEALELFRQGLLGGSGSGSPVASGRFAIGTVGATGVGTGAHLDIRGKDRQGNRLSESRLRELLSLVVVGGKPLSEQLEKITSGYGHRRPPTRGASSFHPALDFGFSRGTSIEFTGQAVSARTFFDKNGGGNVVEITLPNGEKLQLLHLDSVANLGTIQNARVNVPGNTPGNTPRRRMPNVPFASLIESAARQAGIDPLLFAALVRKESGFRQEEKPGQILTSSAGAVGISQLKRDTARELGVNPDKVAENLIGGAKYLAKMLKRFGGNIQLALSAYKAGPGNIRNGQVMAPGTVKDVAIVMQYYREFQQQMAKSGAGQVAPPANQPSAFAITSPTPPDNSRAQELTNRLINQKDRLINLGDAGIRQEIEAFLIELRQTQTTILRQMSDSIRTSRQSVIDAQNSLLDARSQYSPQTQSAQLESELRGVENQFLQLDSQLFEQERGLSDNIQGLDNLLNQMKAVLVILHQSNNQVDKESASFLMGLIGQIEQDKAGYSGMLTQIQSLRGELKQGKVDAQNFVQAQAKLRTIQADLERIGTELNIAQQQNNIEQEKAIALLQSRQQLELDLLQISQDYEGEDRDKRLANAKEEARLREREIEYQFQSKKLNQETELIGQRLAIAQSLSNLGKRNELELLQSQKQLEQEILDIKKQYPDLAEQELRINLAREQARLREIGIENTYRNDRWQREQELLDMDNQIAEAQAERLEAAGDVFGAANLREQAAFAAELLRYEQEIEAIRQRYPDDPQRADELIRKATILQGLNLEKIDRQFKDLGETIRDIGVGAFSTFLEETLTGTKSIGDAFLDMAKSILQSLAQIAARMAISGLFRWMNIPGFSEGGTVPNYADGDTVKSAKVANLPFKRIQEALRKEGTRGVLAVFTPGEEILSLRTGEAQRYQALKMQLGKNPLAKIGNFADGGTIADNLLAGLPNNNMSARLPNGFGQNITNNNYRQGERSVTVNVTAPDPSAFKASERQIARIMSEYLSRV